MTTTYDPEHPAYRDEADVRGELARVFDICHQCRACTDLCAAFPVMFGIFDSQPVKEGALFTPEQQDRVGDGCHHCGACSINCPYTPGSHAWAVDFPRLMDRHVDMRIATNQIGLLRRARRWVARRATKRPKIR